MAISEQEIKEKLEKGFLRVNMVIELVGAPKEHVEDTLRLVLKQLREESGVDVIGGKVHEPKPQGPFFSTFAELQLLLKNFATLTNICFNYMPSSVELIEPSVVKVVPVDFSALFNELLGRLHEIDLKLKNTNAANVLLDKNLNNLLKNTILVILNSGSKSLAELSQSVGIGEQQLEPFLSKFIDEKLISRNGQSYKSLVAK